MVEAKDVGGWVVAMQKEEVCHGKGKAYGGCPYHWRGDGFVGMLSHR